MKNPSSKARVVLSVLIGALLLFSLVPAVMYFPASQFLLNPDGVTEAILASDLTDEVPSLVLGLLESSPELAPLSGNAFLDRLDREDYREILARVAPPEWITIQSAVLARQAQDFVLGRNAVATFSLDLSEVKVLVGCMQHGPDASIRSGDRGGQPAKRLPGLSASR